MTTLWWVVGIIAYFFVGGLFAALAEEENEEQAQAIGYPVLALLWPVVLFLGALMLLTEGSYHLGKWFIGLFKKAPPPDALS